MEVRELGTRRGRDREVPSLSSLCCGLEKVISCVEDFVEKLRIIESTGREANSEGYVSWDRGHGYEVEGA